MVAAVRQGKSLRAVARSCGVSPPTVQRWVDRADGQRLDRVDFSDRPSAPRLVHNRTSTKMERLVLQIRSDLRDKSALGEFGAAAILRELEARGVRDPPARRTIGYILQRHGATDYRQRVRRKPPPPGWYLPDVAAGLCEVDEFDFVEGLLTRDRTEVAVTGVVSLHGGLVGSWPESGFTAELALGAILRHWLDWGLPDYAQFDNDNRFIGPQQHQDAIGRVIRACLSLGVVPVFAPPREHGLQNAIESYNCKWQEKVWARSEMETLKQVQGQSRKYVEAHRARTLLRRESAPARRKFPRKWKYHPAEKITRGRIIFIRRSHDKGVVEVLGHQFEVDRQWVNRLVRCEVDIRGKQIQFYGLRRSEPGRQPLLGTVAYELPPRYIG